METQVSNGRMTLIFPTPPSSLLKTEHEHEMQWCVFEILEKKESNKKTFQLKANCLLASRCGGGCVRSPNEQVWTGPWDGGSPCIMAYFHCWTVPILGMDLHPKDRLLSLLHTLISIRGSESKSKPMEKSCIVQDSVSESKSGSESGNGYKPFWGVLSVPCGWEGHHVTDQWHHWWTDWLTLNDWKHYLPGNYVCIICLAFFN